MNQLPEQPVLDVRDMRVWYAGTKGPVKAVDGLSFSLQRGEIMGLVGESGCGKSTLGRGLLGLNPRGSAMDGHIGFRGENLAELPAKAWPKFRGAGLGMIFQEPMTRLNPLMKISGHFREALRSHEKLSVAQADERALEALRTLGIPPTRYHNYPHEFSGGMRQRIMIALALSMRPEFIVADEPTTALDVLVEAQIMRMLAEIRESFAPAMILVTHNLGIIGQVCDSVAVMYAGRIVEQGKVADVFHQPQHPYTQALLGATINLQTTELVSIPGAPPDLVSPPNGCRFAPRCEKAMQVCLTTQPQATTVQLGMPSTGSIQLECHLATPNLTAEESAPAAIERIADVIEA